MSSFSGIGGKNDKSKGKFSSYNINQYFQGKSTTQQKSSGIKRVIEGLILTETVLL